MPASATPAFRPDQRRALAVFGLLLFSFLLYAPSLASDFVWDDRDAATAGGAARNPLVAELRPLAEYLSGNWWPQRNPHAQTYRPLTTLWFAVRHALCGDDAVVAHLQSVLLHTLGIGLLYRLLRELGAGFAAALFGSAVFAVHALHGEAVLTIVGQAELLGFGFGVLGTLLLLAALRRDHPWPWLAAMLAFTGAYFSKESALVWLAFAPMCVFVARRAGERTLGRAQWLAMAAAAGLPALLFLWLRARMIAGLPPNELGYAFLDNPLAHVDAGERIASALLTWGHGLLLTLLPFRLAIEYGPGQLPLLTRLDDPRCLAAAATALLLVGIAYQALRLRAAPLPALAAAAFVGFTLPISNVFVVVFMQFAERAYFTPTLAAALLAAWCWQRTGHGRARHWTWALAGGWLLASTTVAVQRIFVWRDDRTIIERGVAEAPGSLRMNLCAGALARADGDVARARHHFERAAAIDPASPQPWFELASLAQHAGDAATATRALATARAGRPREVARYRDTLDAIAARIAAASPR